MVRKPLSKKTRYEVFKRDKFTCQYCGSKAPDVELQVDHIDPVSKGGSNELLNLVTSCRECNSGKGNRKIDDDSAVAKQRKTLEDLEERRQQRRMLVEWKEELEEDADDEAEALNSHFEGITGYLMAERYLSGELKKLLNKYGFVHVFDSIDAAADTYSYLDDRPYADKILSKLSGVCYLRMLEKTNPEDYQVYQLKNFAHSQWGYTHQWKTKQYIKMLLDSYAYEEVKNIIAWSRNWTQFKEFCEDLIEEDSSA